MTKRPFGYKGNRVKEVLELVHSDVYSPMNIKERGGYEYYVTIIDDYSRYGYVYPMHHKSETFEKFREFRAEVKKQLAHVLDKEVNKLEASSEVYIFVGYPRGTKMGYFYNPKENIVMVSMNATFLDESYMNDFMPCSKVVLDEMLSDLVILTVPLETNRIRVEKKTQQQPKGLQRSGKIRHEPERFMANRETFLAESLEHGKDPYTYKEAMEDVDANLWT
ncbi:uncharacterized protein LOC112090852 [Morus notabilis]|uniref:uncharacterized protein LOC112090852 n=1 Tax=Morus notabilis TaxID=981085 RepID=UPI000CED450F|nr:uncharacterized protein LOC112090852 [Morus notabilis]